MKVPRRALGVFTAIALLAAGGAVARDTMKATVNPGTIDTEKISESERATAGAELKALLAKMKAGTATQADDRRAVLLMAKLLGLD